MAQLPHTQQPIMRERGDNPYVEEKMFKICGVTLFAIVSAVMFQVATAGAQVASISSDLRAHAYNFNRDPYADIKATQIPHGGFEGPAGLKRSDSQDDACLISLEKSWIESLFFTMKYISTVRRLVHQTRGRSYMMNEPFCRPEDCPEWLPLFCERIEEAYDAIENRADLCGVDFEHPTSICERDLGFVLKMEPGYNQPKF